jgi:hypothetical protein
MREPAVSIRDRMRRAKQARRDRLVQQAIQVGQALQRLREAQGADRVRAVVDLLAAEAALAEAVAVLEAEAKK